MIVRLTELFAVVAKSISLKRLKDPVHIRRYFLKGVSCVRFSPGQRPIPTFFDKFICTISAPTTKLPALQQEVASLSSDTERSE